MKKANDTKIQAYKCSEGKYFYILERGNFTYNSDLFCEYYPTLKAANNAGFDKHDEIIKNEVKNT